MSEHVQLGDLPSNQGSGEIAFASGSRWLSASLCSSEQRKRPRDGGGQKLEFCQGHRGGYGSGLYRLQTLRPLDQSRDILCHPTQRERQLLGLRRSAATQEWQRSEGSVDPASSDHGGSALQGRPAFGDGLG